MANKGTYTAANQFLLIVKFHIVHLDAAYLSLLEGEMTSWLVSCCDQFKPLSQCIAQGLRQGIDVPQDDVEGERELIHVRADLWHLPWTLEYRHLDVQDRVL